MGAGELALLRGIEPVPRSEPAKVSASSDSVGPRLLGFARLELNTRPDGKAPTAFGRFEAAAPNERWTGDALHGPVIAGRKTYLMAFVDDHSRALTGYRLPPALGAGMEEPRA